MFHLQHKFYVKYIEQNSEMHPSSENTNNFVRATIWKELLVISVFFSVYRILRNYPFRRN